MQQARRQMSQSVLSAQMRHISADASRFEADGDTLRKSLQTSRSTAARAILHSPMSLLQCCRCSQCGVSSCSECVLMFLRCWVCFLAQVLPASYPQLAFDTAVAASSPGADKWHGDVAEMGERACGALLRSYWCLDVLFLS